MDFLAVLVKYASKDGGTIKHLLNIRLCNVVEGDPFKCEVSPSNRETHLIDRGSADLTL